MSIAEDAGFSLQTHGRLARLLMATVVVTASAATGYVGSRVWPLPAPEALTMRPAPAPADGTGSAATRETTDPLVAGAPKPVAATGSGPAANVPETAKIEAKSPSAGPAASSSSAAAPDQAPPGSAPSVERSVPEGGAIARKAERAPAARRRAAITRVARSVRRTQAGKAKSQVVEFAPNPRPDQPIRDFMGRPSGSN
jgi:hypothetical protein